MKSRDHLKQIALGGYFIAKRKGKKIMAKNIQLVVNDVPHGSVLDYMVRLGYTIYGFDSKTGLTVNCDTKTVGVIKQMMADSKYAFFRIIEKEVETK